MGGKKDFVKLVTIGSLISLTGFMDSEFQRCPTCPIYSMTPILCTAWPPVPRLMLSLNSSDMDQSPGQLIASIRARQIQRTTRNAAYVVSMSQEMPEPSAEEVRLLL